jgi:hypothetical protein
MMHMAQSLVGKVLSSMPSSADCRGAVEQVDFDTGFRQVEGGLHAGDPGADHQRRSDRGLSVVIPCYHVGHSLSLCG